MASVDEAKPKLRVHGMTGGHMVKGVLFFPDEQVAGKSESARERARKDRGREREDVRGMERWRSVDHPASDQLEV
jgi:hypothetical protein